VDDFGLPAISALAAKLHAFFPDPQLDTALRPVDDPFVQHTFALMLEFQCERHGLGALASTVVADALASYWGGFSGRYSHLDDWVEPAVALLRKACGDVGRPGVSMRPEGLPIAVEAITALLQWVVVNGEVTWTEI